jgi:hypothetical protein
MPGARRHRDAVFLVSPADFDLYEDMTGWSGSVIYRPKDEERPPRVLDGAAECRSDQPAAQRSKGIWGIDPQTEMWCDVCDSMHPIIEHRQCRAAASGGES